MADQELSKKFNEKYQTKKGSFKGKPGTGTKFENCVNYFMTEKGLNEESAKKMCAYIGRKKYGKGNFQAMAAAGKK